jgi:SAM-dependent methyltransferase
MATARLVGLLFAVIGAGVDACARVAGIVAGLLRGIGRRLPQKGWRSTGIYVRWYAEKTWIEFRNKWTRSGRSECPCCGWKGYDFIPLDGTIFYQRRVYCPQCNSYERHRAFNAFLRRRNVSFRDLRGTLLNFAPEKYVRGMIGFDTHYVGADLEFTHVTDFRGEAVQANILRIPLRDESVDAVTCFHLLEHLENEQPALGELRRVLKPGKQAYVMVPLNPAYAESEFFGFPHPEIYGHWWTFGRDFGDRLRRVFECEEVPPEKYLTKEEIFRYGISPQEIVFVCRK